MITSSALMLAVLGYLGVMLKSIPMKIVNFIFNKYSFTIGADTTNKYIFLGVCRYLNSLNNKTLQNNVKLERSEHLADDVYYINSLNYGTYLVFIDILTIAQVSRVLSNNTGNGVKDILSLRIFGLYKNKHRKIVYETVIPDNDKGVCVTHINSSSVLKDFNYVPYKKLTDVFTPITTKLINHVDLWASNKEFFKKNGIIHKTGVLLYGPPGTGKSSIVRALASYLKYEVAILDITSETKSRELVDMVSSIPEKCIVLIEDIDCIPCMDDEVDDVVTNGIRTKNDKSTFRTFLQILDGINSPSDVIFVCTTNHIEKLDYRLLRKGRIDLQLEMTDLDEEYAKKMCDKYNASYDILNNQQFPINPSKLQHMIFENIGIYG